MKRTTLTLALTALIGSLSFTTSSIAVASDHKGNKGSDDVVDADMPRRPAGSTSGSGDTVEANCPTDPSGYDWQGAEA